MGSKLTKIVTFNLVLMMMIFMSDIYAQSYNRLLNNWSKPALLSQVPELSFFRLPYIIGVEPRREMRVVFSTLFSVFGCPDETMSLVFDLLPLVVAYENHSRNWPAPVTDTFFVSKGVRLRELRL